MWQRMDEQKNERWERNFIKKLKIKRGWTHTHIHMLAYYYIILYIRTEAYTSTLGLLAKVKKSYSGPTLKKFQAARHLANANWRQPPENSP